MQLMNTKEHVPDILYIFVNQLNLMTAMNFRHIGSFQSASFASFSLPGVREKYIRGAGRYLPYEPAKADAMAVSPYYMTATNDYRVEYDAEIYREEHFRFFPSRLTSTFAFGSMLECHKVSALYGWPLNEVKRFRLRPHYLNRAVRVNMGHITLARHVYRNSMVDVGLVRNLWEAYWTSKGNIEIALPSFEAKENVMRSGEIWEYLIEGEVEHIDHVSPSLFPVK